MAVSRQDPPEETRQALLAGVEGFLGKDSPLARGIRDRSLHTEPLPVFTLTLQAILANEGLDAVQPAGWRFVTEVKGEVVASDVMDVSEIRQRMTALSRDRRLARVIRFLRDIPDQPEVQRGGDYELRLLRIPAILVDAFWLTSASGAGDLLIPVLSAAEDLQTGRVYGAAEFFNIARPLAGRFQEFDRTGRPPSSSGS